MRRILLDQGLGPAAAALLRAEGWDAVHVSEAGLATAEDSEILEFARLYVVSDCPVPLMNSFFLSPTQ
jgi:predicted nuclease of predicted toxin-antitoxin system